MTFVTSLGIAPRPLLAAMALLLAASPGFTQDKVDAPPRKPFDVFSIAVAADGKTVAAGGGLWDRPGEIGVWNLETGQPLQRFTEPLGVASVAFSPDGKLLASGSWSGHVRIRDWSAAIELADFDQPGVARVAFAPDGKLLATATERNTCQLWDVAAGKLVADLDGDLMRFHCVQFSPDGTKLLAGGGDWTPGGFNRVTVWDVATRRQTGKLVGHDNAILCLTYSPDGKTIATGAIDRTIRLWDAATNTQLKVLRGHRHWVEALAFTADGRTLVSGGHDHTVRFWDVDTGNETGRIDAMPDAVRSIRFTPDHSRLLVGGAKQTLKVFDAATLRESGVLWDEAAVPPVAMETFPVAVPRPAAVDGADGAAAPAHWQLWLGLGVLAALGGAIAVALMVSRRQRRRVPVGNDGGPPAAAPAAQTLACSHCGKGLRVNGVPAGKKVRCPQCAQVMVVPH
jgi:WD40 repeat protein